MKSSEASILFLVNTLLASSQALHFGVDTHNNLAEYQVAVERTDWNDRISESHDAPELRHRFRRSSLVRPPAGESWARERQAEVIHQLGRSTEHGQVGSTETQQNDKIVDDINHVVPTVEMKSRFAVGERPRRTTHGAIRKLTVKLPLTENARHLLKTRNFPATSNDSPEISVGSQLSRTPSVVSPHRLPTQDIPESTDLLSDRFTTRENTRFLNADSDAVQTASLLVDLAKLANRGAQAETHIGTVKRIPRQEERKAKVTVGKMSQIDVKPSFRNEEIYLTHAQDQTDHAESHIPKLITSTGAETMGVYYTPIFHDHTNVNRIGRQSTINEDNPNKQNRDKLKLYLPPVSQKPSMETPQNDDNSDSNYDVIDNEDILTKDRRAEQNNIGKQDGNVGETTIIVDNKPSVFHQPQDSEDQVSSYVSYNLQDLLRHSGFRQQQPTAEQKRPTFYTTEPTASDISHAQHDRLASSYWTYQKSPKVTGVPEENEKLDIPLMHHWIGQPIQHGTTDQEEVGIGNGNNDKSDERYVGVQSQLPLRQQNRPYRSRTAKRITNTIDFNTGRKQKKSLTTVGYIENQQSTNGRQGNRLQLNKNAQNLFSVLRFPESSGAKLTNPVARGQITKSSQVQNNIPPALQDASAVRRLPHDRRRRQTLKQQLITIQRTPTPDFRGTGANRMVHESKDGYPLRSALTPQRFPIWREVGAGSHKSHTPIDTNMKDNRKIHNGRHNVATPLRLENMPPIYNPRATTHPTYHRNNRPPTKIGHQSHPYLLHQEASQNSPTFAYHSTPMSTREVTSYKREKSRKSIARARDSSVVPSYFLRPPPARQMKVQTITSPVSPQLTQQVPTIQGAYSANIYTPYADVPLIHGRSLAPEIFGAPRYNSSVDVYNRVQALPVGGITSLYTPASGHNYVETIRQPLTLTSPNQANIQQLTHTSGQLVGQAPQLQTVYPRYATHHQAIPTMPQYTSYAVPSMLVQQQQHPTWSSPSQGPVSIPSNSYGQLSQASRLNYAAYGGQLSQQAPGQPVPVSYPVSQAAPAPMIMTSASPVNQLSNYHISSLQSNLPVTPHSRKLADSPGLRSLERLPNTYSEQYKYGSGPEPTKQTSHIPTRSRRRPQSERQRSPRGRRPEAVPNGRPNRRRPGWQWLMPGFRRRQASRVSRRLVAPPATP